MVLVFSQSYCGIRMEGLVVICFLYCRINADPEDRGLRMLHAVPYKHQERATEDICQRKLKGANHEHGLAAASVMTNTY